MKRTGAGFVLALAVLALAGAKAEATLIVSAVPTSASIGSSGNGFDIVLTNTGMSSVDIGGFVVDISVASGSGVTFTGANISTTLPYIFGMNGLFSPNIGVVSNGGLSLNASDIFATPLSGATIGSGVTVGLAHILFDVASNANPGVVTVTISPFPATNLSNFLGNDVPIDTLSNGSITLIRGTTPVVPEPSAMVLAAGGLLAFAGGAGWRRRRSGRVTS